MSRFFRYSHFHCEHVKSECVYKLAKFFNNDIMLLKVVVVSGPLHHFLYNNKVTSCDIVALYRKCHRLNLKRINSIIKIHQMITLL